MNYRQWKKYYKYFKGTCRCDDICHLFTNNTIIENYVIVKWCTPQKILKKRFKELVK